MSYEAFKATWRPGFGWALVFINIVYAMVIALLLLMGVASLAEATPFMMAQIGQGTVIGSVTAAGRSWEKRHGQDRSGFDHLPPEYPEPDQPAPGSSYDQVEDYPPPPRGDA